MTASNRAARIAKLHTALKKNYKPVPSPSRPLMEHLLYACLLEGAPAELADEGLAKLEQQYFDWNEVRVTTVAEIAEALASLPAPMAAATRLKRCLQSAFEAFYSFDLEDLKKQNLGKAVEQFEELPGMTPFVSAYVTQQGLGGHAVPVDSGGLRIMFACGIINETEWATRKVPGLERAISKNKGAEFGSLLQQASVALRKDAKDKTVQAVVAAVDKGGVELLTKAIDKPAPEEAEESKSAAGSEAQPSAPPAKKTAKKVAAEKDATPKKSSTKKPAKKKSSSTKAAARVKKTSDKAAETESPSKKAKPSKKLTKRKPR